MAGITKHYILDVAGHKYMNKVCLVQLIRIVGDRIRTTRDTIAFSDVRDAEGNWRKRLRTLWAIGKPLIEARHENITLTEYRHYRKRKNQPAHKESKRIWGYRHREDRAENPFLRNLLRNAVVPATPAAPPPAPPHRRTVQVIRNNAVNWETT